jgi:xanthine dehydrogenase molybdenum-binding subunit
MSIKVDEHGNVDVLSGGTDQGQGSSTVLSQIIAEALGFRPEDISMTFGDTELCLWDAGTHASRHTFVAGNAALMACQKVKTQILEMAVAQIPGLVKFRFKREKRKNPDFVEPDLNFSLIASPEKLDIKDRMVFPKDDPDHPYFKMDVSQILRNGLHVGTGESKTVMAEAFYDPPTEMLDRELKGNLSCTYAFGTTGVEVEVDVETGEVKIVQLFAAHDVGKAINPKLLEGQIYGAGYIGVGYGLTEEMKMRDGRVMNASLRDYKMLTAMDVIPVTPIVVELGDADGPFGAKGIGEPGLVPTAPAIANAVYDAIGVRIRELPITPEKVLAALKDRGDVC